MDADAPTLTVIIPAYNEGAMVEKTIDSCIAARYPRDRLQIIAVDDGSRDDTWAWIERAAARHGSLVTPIRFERNQGKRAALAAGFERARGEIVVTIDSDSIIEPQTLLAIAGPFADPRVGAVAGNVRVLNRKRGLLPAMLAVRFGLSFDFIRSTESTYRTVYCCPGALAAYRAEVVRRVLPAWIEQRFLGTRCTIGEDRAMTNDILAQGYDAVYQRTAVVHTLVPERFGKMCKMLLRWDRSFVREESRLARIVWKRPAWPMIATVVERTIVNVLRLPVALYMSGLFVTAAVADPTVVLRVALAIATSAFFYSLYYLRTERSWQFLYGIAYAFVAFFSLFWIYPYALMTARKGGWLTR
ncbi:MAG: glycosyltransferase [Burkholderiaceae bacterium]